MILKVFLPFHPLADIRYPAIHAPNPCSNLRPQRAVSLRGGVLSSPDVQRSSEDLRQHAGHYFDSLEHFDFPN